MNPGSLYFSPPSRRGFSLVELLAVVAIMVTVMALVAPIMNSLKGSADVSKAAYEIKGALDQARAYAMAKNTFVWVGFFEEDGSTTSAAPATPGTGRVVIASVASKDGTRGYDVNSSSLATPAWSSYSSGANFVAINKLKKFDNLHLVDFGGVVSSGNMARPSYPAIGGINYTLGASSCTSVTSFDWPLGSALGAGQYSFTKVIHFDPQGIARIQGSANADQIGQVMELGIQPTHGSVAPAVPSNQNVGNHAAIQIECMTGATRIYRP